MIDTTLAWPILFTPDEIHSEEPSDNIILSLKKNFFTNTIPMIIPFVNIFLENLTIPPQQTDWVDINTIHFTQLKVGDASLDMSSPNNLFLSIEDINLVMPDIGFVLKTPLLTCDGKVRAVINITDAKVLLTTHRLVNGSLRLKVMETNISWKNIQTHHTLEGTGCSFMEKIIAALLGNLDDFIAKTMKKEVPEKVGPLVENKARDFLDSLPVLFTKDPDITFERIIFEMKLNPKTSDFNTQFPKRLYRNEPHHPQTDFGLLFSEITINNFVRYLRSIGKLNQTIALPSEYDSSLIESIYPEVYKYCPNCPFSVRFDAKIPPLVELNLNQSSIVHVTNGFVGLSMIPLSGDVIPVIEMLVNFTGGVKNLELTKDERLIFNLTNVNITLNVLKTNIHPINVTELYNKLSWFLNDVCIPLFNVKFTGITLPSQISKPVLNISSKTIFTGFDFK
ncbi:ESAG-like protein [Trypanosoma theileri]|uniref:ESAG-like protein n=1 Tax=Trypanosoma theileri TaxID=67003 RepID=A0A1X0PA44_9TRYP|nr:ESAG-like protein [Trypanosoma theileri]ORC93802.1 ESAG-like protein [Trypanosoma theileri]